MNNAKKDKQQNGAAQAENLHSDAVPRLGHFLNHSHWLEGLKLLKYQLERKKENRHFLTLEMCYYAKLEQSLEQLEHEEYFKTRIANNLFYGLEKEFAVHPYMVPKSNLGLRRYKFMTCPMRVLYYAVGIYLFRLSEKYLKGYKDHRRFSSHYGGFLSLSSGGLELEPDSVYFASHYEEFCDEVKKENKRDIERKVVIRLDIQNFYDELRVPLLLDLLKKRIKPSIQSDMRYTENTQAQLVSFFDFVAGGATGIPQSDNNIISSFIGNLFLVFGDLYLDDELQKYADSVENHRIIRYVDDIYISITFKEQNGELRTMFNPLATRFSDCLYENLGLRLNPKTTIYRLEYEDDRIALEKSLKKVSHGMEILDEENDESPEERINNIFDQLNALKCFPIAPYFQGHIKSDCVEEEFNEERFKDHLKAVYDNEVIDLIEDPDCPFYRYQLRQIFTKSDGFDFELINAYPKPIIILILMCKDVAQKFEEFLLSKSKFTSRDISLALLYLCQNQGAQNQLLYEDELIARLKDNPQMKEIMETYTQERLSSELPGYFNLTGEQLSKVDRPYVIDQIRLRVLCEQKGEFSVALNHLLNEIHAICYVLDGERIPLENFNAHEVRVFLEKANVPHQSYSNIVNLFDRRHISTVSHPDPRARAVDKDEYKGYRDNVKQCLKHLSHLLDKRHCAHL